MKKVTQDTFIVNFFNQNLSEPNLDFQNKWIQKYCKTI